MSYEWDVDGQLDVTLSEYQDDRKAHWTGRTDGSDWNGKLIGHAERLANAVLADTEFLVGQHISAEAGPAFETELREFWKDWGQLPPNWDEIRMKEPELARQMEAYGNYIATQADHRPDDGTLLRLVWEKLCIEVAWPALRMIVPGANRMLLLLRTLADAKPSDDALRYLQRASRCFVWGFHIECILLCRGVLDRCMQDAISDQMCEQAGCKPNDDYDTKFTMSQRIKAALRHGVIDEGGEKAARRVSKTANDLIHKKLSETVDVLSTLRDTISVLNQLCRPI